MSVLPLAGLEVVGKETVDDRDLGKNREKIIVAGGRVLGFKGGVGDGGLVVVIIFREVIIGLQRCKMGRGGCRAGVHAAIASARLSKHGGREVGGGGGEGGVDIFLLQRARRMISRCHLRVRNSAGEPRRRPRNVRLEQTQRLPDARNFLVRVHPRGAADAG